MKNLENTALTLSAKLTEIAFRNTSEAISNRIAASKAKRVDKETINDLQEIINNLIKDKNDLITISRTYEEEFIMRQISEKDLKYITENLIPVLKNFLHELMSSDLAQNENIINNEEFTSLINILSPMLSTETFKILQLLGFDFKSAIGEPLTLLIKNLILSKSNINDLKVKETLTPEMVEVLKNKNAFDNFYKLVKNS